MKNWDTLIHEAIARCQFIFVDDLGDRRLPCEIDPELFRCHGIDEIQLCAYCFAMNENLLEKLQWKIEKKEDVYYFYPIADKEFRDALREMKDTYPECNVRGNYLKNGKLTSVYRICEGEKEAEEKSCPLIIDMIFHLNRKERSKAELDNFIALFSCMHIMILRRFLFDAVKYMQNLDVTEGKLLLNEIVNIMDKVLSIRKYINGKNKQEAICEELRRSSAKIITLVYDKKKQISIRDNFAQDFDYKMSKAFSASVKWRYNRNIRGKNCRDLFRSLVKMCFGEVTFDQVRGVDIIEAGISDVNKARELLITEEI